VQSIQGHGVYRLETLDGTIMDRPVHAQRLKQYHLRDQWEPMIVLDEPPLDDQQSDI